MIARLFAPLYGAACYAAFIAVFLYAAGFIGGFLTPTTLDAPASRAPIEALLIDLGLILVFGLQHSGMARPAFKRWWTRVVPQWAERSTYVLASSLALATWLLLWEPVGGTLWRATDAVYYIVVATYVGGWLLLLYSSLLIDHLDLFGLSQAWHRFTGARHESPAFHAPGLYARVRHPIYLGWLLIVWAAPTMTYGHLLFAAGSTLYILVGARFEERDLVGEFGERYVEYRRHTPMLIPRVSGKELP